MKNSKDLKYTLGLDLGITSIGWSVVELKDDNSPYRLRDTGVRIFTKPEKPKNGESNNVARRDARGVRRTLHRRKQRQNQLKKIFKEKGFYSDWDSLQLLASPWELRSKSLDKLLTNEELVKAVLHLSKRRGFKSNRKSHLDKEGGVYKPFIDSNNSLLKEKGYRTYGEMFFKDSRFADKKRNSNDDYLCMVARSNVLEELSLILNTQKNLDNGKLTDELITKIIDIVEFQRPFSTPEGLDSMIGFCTFEPDEKRAPVKSYSFEKFRLLQGLNNLRYQDRRDYKEYSLNAEQRLQILELAHKKEISYGDIRKELEFSEDILFKNLNYFRNELDTKKTEKEKFNPMKGYHEVRKSIDKVDKEFWQDNYKNEKFLNNVAYIFTIYKTEEELKKELKNLDINLSKGLIASLLGRLSFKKFGHLSIKALQKINLLLEEGKSYTEAVIELYPSQKQFVKSKKLPVIPSEEIRNPVVNTALSQSRKVINAIINKYGSPTLVKIEVARDMSRNFKDRRKIENNQKENHKRNESIINDLKEKFNIAEPNGTDILKYKLWREQQGKCAYSMQPISADRLFEPNYTQIDHAIPFSRSYNDSYFNKVVVLTKENQDKRDLTPFEYYQSNGRDWIRYKAFIDSLHISINKKSTILREETSSDEIDILKKFVERDLNDSRYISKYLKTFIEENLEFKPSEHKKKVYTYNGRFTAILKKQLGFSKKDRDENNRHHALDATLIAVANDSLMQQVAKYFKEKEDIFSSKNIGEKIKFPEPWLNFRDDVNDRIFKDDFELSVLYSDINEDLKPLFVSHAVRRKASGAVHKDTIYSPKLVEEGIVKSRKDIKSIKLKDLDNVDGEGKNIIDLLRRRLETFDDDPKKAFAEPVYKLKKDGSRGNQIKKLTVKEVNNSVVLLNNGKAVAAQGGMVRIDIFEKDKKFYVVPVYLSDTINEELPTQIVPMKSNGEYDHVDDTYRFRYSFYPNDYVKLRKDNVIDEGYYVKMGRSSGAIVLKQHDRPDITRNLGVRSVNNIEKYQISPLGEKHLISKEKRVGFKKDNTE